LDPCKDVVGDTFRLGMAFKTDRRIEDQIDAPPFPDQLHPFGHSLDHSDDGHLGWDSHIKGVDVLDPIDSGDSIVNFYPVREGGFFVVAGFEDFEKNSGFEIFTETDRKSFRECESKLEYLNKQLKFITKDNTYILSNERIEHFGLNKVENLIQNKFEGQLDTGKMMYVLSEKVRCLGVKILNGLEIKQIHNESNGVTLMTSEGFQINAGKVVICTNGFAKEFLSELSISPGRAQVLITGEIKHLKLHGSFHYQGGFYYFRNVNNRVLIGGGRNLDIQGETTTKFGLTQPIQASIENLLNEIILSGIEYKIEQRWSGIMGLGESKSPIIQEIRPNIYCAVRLGGMGVALGYLVGMEVAELVNQNY